MPAGSERLFQEIAEQPALLRQMVADYPARFEGIKLPGRFTQKLIGIAEGSSYHALRIAAPFIEELTGLNTFSFKPEELDYKFRVSELTGHPLKRLFANSYFLAVSQSGKTASLVGILDQLQQALHFADKHAPLATFTNNPEGVLSQRFGNHFALSVGEEKSIAATKSMTASIMGLLLFGLHLGRHRGRTKNGQHQHMLGILRDIPEQLATLLENPAQVDRVQAFARRVGSRTNQFVILSKGLLSAVLPEIGLKLTETSSNIVTTDNTESFKHGPKVILKGVKGIRPNCIYIVPPNLTPPQADQFFQDVRSHFFTDSVQTFSTDGVYFATFENSPAIPDELKQQFGIKKDEVLTLPPADELAALFVALVTFQLFSYYLAQAKGEDPNNPALQKAVI